MKYEEGELEFCLANTGNAEHKGPWDVVLWAKVAATGDPVLTGGWWIVNQSTRTLVYIGRVGAKRASYYEEARNEAERRNARALAGRRWLTPPPVVRDMTDVTTGT